MTVDELLLELRDIQAPPEPGWWLLAPGYIAISCLLAMLLILVWYGARRRKAKHLLDCAQTELQRIKSAHQRSDDSQQLALELSRWLKQVALLAYPEQRLEGLTGVAWLRFLDRSIGDNSFTRGAGRIFGDAVYQPRANPDSSRICSICDQWLAAVKPRLLLRGRD